MFGPLRSSEFIFLMRADYLRRPLADFTEEIEAEFNSSDLEEFQRTPASELTRVHSSVGRYIRDRWIQREDSPLLTDLHEAGLRWPDADALSRFLTAAFWYYLNSAPFDAREHLRSYGLHLDPEVEAEANRADPLKIKARFDAVYAPVGGMILPEDALSERRAGEIVEQGWTILYQFGSADGVEFMDVYDMHRMTSDSHWRIFATGAVEHLPAFREAMPYPRGASEEEVRRLEQEQEEHNASVRELIERKWSKQMHRALKACEQKLRELAEHGPGDEP